ncbi:WD40-repeat-containing domain protein [Mycena sp. CBHHK59/15]|nr:WD40-repeat-containing domain protein [Mycena sp. CBHHK59/15]
MMALSATRTARKHRRLVSRSLCSPLNRVQVLDGHSGCVNALSWAKDGELLLSGGDDRTIRIWGPSMDPSSLTDCPSFVCRSVMPTGHLANIFNAHMLPYSSQIATVAGDGQVRVHDVREALSGSAQSNSRQLCVHRLRCHGDRVKRLVTEDSPHLFLTVGEDGTVRQHDLRTSHDCDYGSCPPPLIQLDFELSTLSLSSLTPYQFVVAGESPYGFLFDRRQAGRFLLEERGMVENGMTHCIRRFGRPEPSPDMRITREHITGARMSSQNGHEVLLSYSADAVYLYSTRDEPKEKDLTHPSPLLAQNDKLKIVNSGTPAWQGDSVSDAMDVDIEDNASEDEHDHDVFKDWDEYLSRDPYSVVPLVHPRRRFAGARNVHTIKDVNFLGPDDEYVTSGSDDGHFFVWRKDGSLHGIFEGDSTVVNVIEGHPHLPLIAVSGIDTTVKLFSPVPGPSAFSRMESAESIIAANTRQSNDFRKRRYDFISLMAEARAATSDGAPQCSHQ